MRRLQAFGAVLLLVLGLALSGCAGRPTLVRGHRVAVVREILWRGAEIVESVDAVVAERIEHEPYPCDDVCMQPYERTARALEIARHNIRSAWFALDAVDRHDDGNAAAVVTCAVASVSELLRTAQAARARPPSYVLDMWAAYAASIGGSLCDLADPNARLGAGEAD